MVCVGERFGILTVVECVGRKQTSGGNRLIYRCSCACGGSKIVTNSDLVCGGIKSCGCLAYVHPSTLIKGNYDDLAKTADYMWLGGDVPLRESDNTNWFCPRGHIFVTSYGNFKRGSRCKQCYQEDHPKKIKKEKLSLREQFIQLGKLTDCAWFGDQCEDKYAPATWFCGKCVNPIRVTFIYLKNRGCPICRRRKNFINSKKVSTPQLILAKVLNIPKEHINYNVGTKFVDIAYPEDRIAIEYDGVLWHTSEEKEQLRDEYILNLGWKLLHIKSSGDLPMVDEILSCMEQLKAGATRLYITLP